MTGGLDRQPRGLADAGFIIDDQSTHGEAEGVGGELGFSNNKAGPLARPRQVQLQLDNPAG